MSIISEGIEKINRFVRAINQITHDNLAYTEQAALANLLNAYHEASAECSLALAHRLQYEGAVGYLCLAFRITHEQKMSLLDLLG